MKKRILVHDYSGHPFQAQLSRSLASRGWDVLHVSADSPLVPHGALQLMVGDPKTLSFAELRFKAIRHKQVYLRRFLRDREYGNMLFNQIVEYRPEFVISGGTPLDAQALALRGARKVGASFVFWLQDIQGIAIRRLLSARFGWAGSLVGQYYCAVERRLLLASDAVVAISTDFTSTLGRWGIPARTTRTIPNWASTQELPAREKDNLWSRPHGVANRFCYLYTGTLGLKHNPDLLLQLAVQVRNDEDVVVIVISEGAGADWLKQRKAELLLDRLQILPYQPYAELPDVMGSADVLVAILESDAGVFSVPSKVLSYFCAGKPLLLAVPQENLAARTVLQIRAGVVVDPKDLRDFLKAAAALRTDADGRRQMGANALRYAITTFDIGKITDRFEAIFSSIVKDA